MAGNLTEAQCWALFEHLFPNGLVDRTFVEELAPEGWDRSPLLLVSHPTAEQVKAIPRPMSDAQAEKIKRYFGVIAEGLRSDLRQLAEGHSGIRRELHELHKELFGEFKKMRTLMCDCKT